MRKNLLLAKFACPGPDGPPGMPPWPPGGGSPRGRWFCIGPGNPRGPAPPWFICIPARGPCCCPCGLGPKKHLKSVQCLCQTAHTSQGLILHESRSRSLHVQWSVKVSRSKSQWPRCASRNTQRIFWTDFGKSRTTSKVLFTSVTLSILLRVIFPSLLLKAAEIVAVARHDNRCLPM